MDIEKQRSVSRETFDEVMVPSYNPQAMVPVRGEGTRVWDQDGQEYIDFTSGIAVNVLGHCHPDLVHVLDDQGKKLWHLSNVFTNEPALALAKTLVERTFADKVFFCNSGTEANEAAFKLARKYAYDRFGPEKHEIISFNKAFHGRSLFTVSVGGQPKYREGFQPTPAGITHLPFNDIDALKGTISDKTCAVVLEPIQGEGGIITADSEFLKAVRTLCDKHNALVVFDEVQTGVGRTGKLYAYMDTEITPDIMTTAKALGGGFPIGAMLTKTNIAQSLGFGTHGSTSGGNPLACAVAKEVLDHVDDALLQGVQHRHDLFVQCLASINSKYEIFKEIRGKGLLIGAVLSDAWAGKAKLFLQAAIRHSLMCLVAGPDVIRIAPSLIISDGDIHEGMHRLEAAIAEVVAAQ